MTDRPSAEEIEALFATFQRTGRRRDRNRLVEAHTGFAAHIARRYANRGVADEDLRQVALLALVKAVDRFDPTYGVAFTSFAGRTIEGEIKRHFRDTTWAVKVPRSAKEMHLLVRRANDELSATLGRSPTVREVAHHLEVDPDAVVEALGTAAAFSSSSLDSGGADNDDQPAPRSAQLADIDDDLELAPDRVLVDRLLAQLPDRERRIVELRFFGEKTQSEIADLVGVSQMHVSRLLRRSFTLMRQLAGETDEP